MNITRTLCLILYYGFARWLPASTNSYLVVFRIIRRFCAKHLFKRSGIKVNVERGAYFSSGKHVEIGDYSGIGVNCWINGPIKIGRYVMMGPDVVIIARNHNFDRLDIPMQSQGSDIDKTVTINDDVWIGTRVIILPGITIGKGVIVGAGAVVTKDVPPYAIVGGNPAKIIKYRTS